MKEDVPSDKVEEKKENQEEDKKKEIIEEDLKVDIGKRVKDFLKEEVPSAHEPIRRTVNPHAQSWSTDEDEEDLLPNFYKRTPRKRKRKAIDFDSEEDDDGDAEKVEN